MPKKKPNLKRVVYFEEVETLKQIDKVIHERERGQFIRNATKEKLASKS